MKYGVNRQVLLITAGIVWIVAGANILRIGIVTWLNDSQYWLFKVGEATVVFLLFFVLVFRKLYYKHTRRIEQKKKEKNCPFSFFDAKGWIVMCFMIAMGITIRTLHLLPDTFISVFYTGLSCSQAHYLYATGGAEDHILSTHARALSARFSQRSPPEQQGKPKGIKDLMPHKLPSL